MKNLLLVAVLAFAVACAGNSQKKQPQTEEPKVETDSTTVADSTSASINLSIEGMSCSKVCVKKIKEKVASISGVSSVEIDFDNKVATVVSSKEVEASTLVEAINGIEGGQYTASLPKSKEEKTEEKTN